MVRIVPLAVARDAGRLRSWIVRAASPQALVGTRAELPWALFWATAVAVAAATDLVAPRSVSMGVLASLPVLAASWMLGGAAVAAVLAVPVALEAAGVVLGDVSGAGFAARVVTIGLVALAGRAAAVNAAHVRWARHQEAFTVLQASRLLDRSFERAGPAAAEAVRVAVTTLATPGAAFARAAALLRLEGHRVVVLAAEGEAGLGRARQGDVPASPVPGPVREVLATGRAAVAECRDLEPVLGDAPAGARRTWALARVDAGGESFGVLAVAAREGAGLGRDDLRLVDDVARVAGLAIGNAMQHAQLAELKQRLQDSVELALEAGRSLEPTKVVDSILLRVARSLGADEATLVRVDGQQLVVESAYRAGELLAVRRRFPSESVEGVPVLARALASGEPVLGGRLEASVGGEELAAALPVGPHTLVLPFPVAGRSACLLMLARSQGPAFGEADVGHLEPMADVALLALRNAHLHAQTERAERAAMTYSGSLEQAIEAAGAIGSGEELSDVVERVLQRAVAVVGADRGSICRVEGESVVLEHDYDPEGGPAAADTRWQLAEVPLAGEAIRRRAPLCGELPEGNPSPAMARWLELAQLRHVIQCPLLVEREVVGMLSLSRRRDEPFTEADLQALRPFATLAGPLLRNARLLAEARRVGQAKSAFLNLAAHELRTPLAVIKGYLSLLEDGTYPVPDRTREEAIDTLIAKAQELESLVEGLLTTARLEVGTLPSSRTELDLCQAVREAAARVRPRARLEGARIDLSLPPADLRARADRGQVGRILDNLLNNALTYSRRPAAVEIELRPGPPLEVAVRDRGHGIPADQQERVFERFYRVEGSASRFSPGLGLGLSISRELAQLNGGALLLERSVPGEGSVFVVRLPAA